MITVTENAVKHLRSLLAPGEEAGRGLRLMVERGGCAGWQYTMKLGDRESGDAIIEENGVRFFVCPESAQLLRDAEIDYVESLTDTGFKINNPNAARSCGCGSSFEAAEEGKEPAYDPSQDGSACGDDANGSESDGAPGSGGPSAE